MEQTSLAPIIGQAAFFMEVCLYELMMGNSDDGVSIAGTDILTSLSALRRTEALGS